VDVRIPPLRTAKVVDTKPRRLAEKALAAVARAPRSGG
jgi:hypothetical protein